MKSAFSLLCLLLIFKTSKGQTDTLNVSLNFSSVSQALLASPHEINMGIGKSSKSESIVYLPYKDGEFKAFKLLEYDILPFGLRKEIKTYYGQMLENPSVECRVTLTNKELKGSLYGPDGTFAIEKNIRSNTANAYWIYKVEAGLPSCELNEDNPKNGRIGADKAIMYSSHGTELRTYRLALVITSTFYSQSALNTDATVNAHIAAIVNNINGIYEKEIAVRFTLVSPNNPVSTNVFSVFTTSTDLSDVNTELISRYGSTNFDVGHLLLPSGGGVAQLRSVCGGSKGRARSGVSSASNVFIFAHELGHQFNAGHTFNGNGSGNCGPSNRMNNDAYEPGSGNTIMSYANLCSPSSYNITGGQSLYFHTHSQESMINFIKSTSGACATVTNTGNAVPVVEAMTNFIIPRNTPFTLSGTATDADSDPLIYTWEQYNLATVADTGRLGNTANALGTSAVNSPTAPLFRTVQSSSATRNFPNLIYVLNNANNPPNNVGEDLPNVARTLNFRLTARDNKPGGGGVAFQQLAVTISNHDPFEVITGNGPTLWFQGETKTINWNVSNTNLAPINCANVKISTSVDGGTTFTTLVASTPNDGSHSFTVPNTPTSQFRIKIEAVGNVFYDINNVNMTISNGTCQPEVSTLLNPTAMTAIIGDLSLNLNLISKGTQITTYSNSITINSPGSNFVSKNASGLCTTSSNSLPRHNLLTFVSENTGNNVFTVASGGTLPSVSLNLYNNPYNPDNQCNNWLNSSSNSTSLTQNLQAGNVYQLRISGASSNHTGTFTINLTGNTVYNSVPASGSLYNFTYLIYNISTNLITGFDPQANLVSYPEGSYRIYGLSYAGGIGTNLDSYINTSFLSFQTVLSNATICGQLSTNFKNVTILSTNPCQTVVSLSSPEDNISTGDVVRQASSGTGGKIIATNIVSGANTRATYQARSIELNQGFIAESGTIFRAETGGCN